MSQKYRFCHLYIFFSVVFLSGAFSSGFARSVVEEYDKVSLDWSSLKINFYGEANILFDNGESELKDAEVGAWNAGLAYVDDMAKKIHMQKLGEGAQNEGALNAALQITTTTYSVNTIYFGSGKVKVQLQNSLIKLFKTGSLAFLKTEIPDTTTAQNSGIVLKVSQKISPRAYYELTAPSGQVLFNVGKVAEKAFDQNLMGRWFNDSKSKECLRFIGENPIEIPVTVNGTSFVVDQQTWDKAITGNEVLLEASKIAVVFP